MFHKSLPPSREDQESRIPFVLSKITKWFIFGSFTLPCLVGLLIMAGWAKRWNTIEPSGILIFILGVCFVMEIVRVIYWAVKVDTSDVTGFKKSHDSDVLTDFKQIMGKNPLVDHSWSDDAHTLLMQADFMLGRAIQTGKHEGKREITPLEIMIASFCGNHAGTELMQALGLDTEELKKHLLTFYAAQYPGYQHFNAYSDVRRGFTTYAPRPSSPAPAPPKEEGFPVVKES